jgi:1-acyl-sn-glycerol-3-phosphate acyltransferase
VDLVYPAVIALSRLLFATLGLRIAVVGGHHIPSSGPAILMSNHVSFLDFVFVGLAARPGRRYVRFLTRYDVWDNALAGPAMTGMHHIPVDRAAPAGAYLEARGALRRGEVVGVFPEAGISRSFTVRPLMPGAVALARDTGAPLLPVAIWGPQRISTIGHPMSLRRRRPVSISVGAPLLIPAELEIRAATAWVAHQLQRQLESAQVGHPDQPAADGTSWWHPRHLDGAAPRAVEAAAVADVPRWAVRPADASGLF